jgi:formylglycine-generating enzyme
MTNACASIVGLTICLLLCGCLSLEQPSSKEGEGHLAPRAGATKTVDLGDDVKLELVWCPPGTFTMGSSMAERRAAVAAGGKMEDYKDETQHKVTLTKGFWLGKHEVTQRQWQSVMGKNPSWSKSAGLDAPVEQVSWNDCQEFVKKLNAPAGHEYRLPTESEWEYACRAGTTTAFHYGDGLDSSQANFDGLYPFGNGRKGEYRETTVKVGSFRPNAWGLYDMHGNVWEWCQDWYGDYPSGAVTDPTGTGAGRLRVLRGGSWNNFARYCRSAIRIWDSPTYSNFNLGLRVALVPVR